MTGIFETVAEAHINSSAHGEQRANTAVVDFFSGCGGMSVGFDYIDKWFGSICHLGAFDNDPYANETFKRNIGVPVTESNLFHFNDYEEISKLKQDLKEFDRTILIGCAPCQGFSALTKTKNDRARNNNLLLSFGDILSFLLPDLFIVENVPDLFSERHKFVRHKFFSQVKNLGYKLNQRIINMAEFGVPQERFRAVILGGRDGSPEFPDPLYSPKAFKTVREAIGGLPILATGETSKQDAMHKTSCHRNETLELFKNIPKDGGSRPIGIGPKCLDRVKGYSDVYGRLYWDRPSVTITARCRTPSCGRFVHPEQNRGLSIREAALLQSFPSKYVFCGPFDDKFKQIGNAIPPLFSLALAEKLTRKELVICDESAVVEDFTSFGIYIAHNKRRTKQHA